MKLTVFLTLTLALAERPVRQAEQLPQPRHHPVDDHRRVIGMIAEIGEPALIVDDGVELVAMDDEHAFAVGRLIDPVGDDDAAEIHALELTGEFVVIAGDIGDVGALARLAQQFLHDVIVALRPVPAPPQPPAINDITDQIDDIGIVIAQEIDQEFGLRRLRAEMDVGNEHATESAGLLA